MAFHDLRAFLERLEAAGRLRRVAAPVEPDLESTAFPGRRQQAQDLARAVPRFHPVSSHLRI